MIVPQNDDDDDEDKKVKYTWGIMKNYIVFVRKKNENPIFFINLQGMEIVENYFKIYNIHE